MLEILKPDLVSGNKHLAQYWDYLKKVMTSRLDYYRRRYDVAAENTNYGIQLLHHVISNTDINVLVERKDDIDIYIEDLLPYADSVKSVFDPVYTTSTNNKYFTNCKRELLLNTSYKTPLTDLPVNKPYMMWLDVQPLTMIYHDSPNLIYNISDETINFSQDPNYVVWSLNVPVLLLKYLKWVKYYKQILKTEVPPIREFIKTDVIRLVQNDLPSIWLQNIINQRLDEKISKNLGTFTVSRDITSNSLRYAVADLDKLIDMVENRVINIRDFLVNDWLLYGSLTDKINSIMQYHILPPLRQYEALRFLEEFNMIEIALKLYWLNGRTQQNSKVLLYFKNQLKKCERDVIQNSSVRNTIALQTFDEKINKLSNLVN